MAFGYIAARMIPIAQETVGNLILPCSLNSAPSCSVLVSCHPCIHAGSVYKQILACSDLNPDPVASGNTVR